MNVAAVVIVRIARDRPQLLHPVNSDLRVRKHPLEFLRMRVELRKILTVGRTVLRIDVDVVDPQTPEDSPGLVGIVCRKGGPYEL